MPSSYDPLLRLELQVTGENENTWGDKTNTTIELLGQAIAGHTEVDLTGSGTYALSASNAATDEARQAFLTLTGLLTGARVLQIPTASKIYYLNRLTTGDYSLTVQMASGASVVLPATGLSIVASDGTDCWQVAPPTGAVRVSVSSNSSVVAALHVTQTGVGPVFLAEDQGSDGSPFVINSNGEILSGTTVGYTMEGFAVPSFQTHRTGTFAGPLAMTWSNTATGPASVLAKSRGTAIGTPGAVTTGDVLGRLYFAGDAGGNIQPAAYVGSGVEIAVSASVVAGYLSFATRNAAGTLLERLRLTAEGNLRLASATMAAPTGNAPLFAARAFGKFDNNGTVFHAENVASVVRNAVGDYTVTFSTNMADADYTLLVWSSNNTGASFTGTRFETTPTASNFRIQVVGNSGTDIDPSIWNFVVFR